LKEISCVGGGYEEKFKVHCSTFKGSGEKSKQPYTEGEIMSKSKDVKKDTKKKPSKSVKEKKEAKKQKKSGKE